MTRSWPNDDGGVARFAEASRLSRRSVLSAAALSAAALALPALDVAAATIAPKRAARRNALFAARNWVSFYAGPFDATTMAGLKRYDLIDTDADEGNFDSRAEAKAAVTELRADRRLVVSYLNIGAAETFRWYWPDAKAFKRDAYDGWPGEYWMDVREPGWRNLIVSRVAPVLERAGIDGFFLDNIDVAGRYPDAGVRNGVIEIVRRLRERFPQLLIIGQSYEMEPYLFKGSDGRFFYEYLDGTSKEEVNSTYDGGYHLIPRAESDRMLAELRAFRDRGLYVGVLDYAVKREDVATCIRRSTASGLLPFVSDHDLDSVKVWDSAAGPNRPGRPTATRVAGTITLRWPASNDDMGVSRYDIRRDGKVIGNSRLPEFVDDDPPDGSPSYRVRAWDTGRMSSPWSAPSAPA